MITAKTDIYCVVGNPVSHSKSPLIHNYIFNKLGIDAVYVAFEVKNLETFFSFVRDVGIKGVSITIPHKVDALKFVDKVEEFALKIGAINTVKNINGVLEGYNTDIEGIIKSFESSGIDSLEGKTAMIIGNGGVARSCVWAFVKMGIRSIIVVGRNYSKVLQFVNEVKPNFEFIDGGEFRDIDKFFDKVDVIANCTPLGMYPNVDEMPIDSEYLLSKHIVFDTIYTPSETKFLKLSREVGAKVVYGLDMFVYQALAQEKIWFGNEEIFSMKDEIINLLNQIR